MSHSNDDGHLQRFIKPLSDDRIAQALPNPPRRHRSKTSGSTFLRGPVPISWLAKAGRLPGKCMTLGIIIWFLRGLTKKETFRLEHQWCRLFGIGRGAIGNDLIELEKAGLVSVVRGRGRSPVVTIITGEGER